MLEDLQFDAEAKKDCMKLNLEEYVAKHLGWEMPLSNEQKLKINAIIEEAKRLVGLEAERWLNYPRGKTTS